MLMLDSSLRGGAVALLALLAIAGWRDPGRTAADRYSVPFDICAIAYLLESAPALHALHAGWIVPFRLLSVATPAIFEIWTAAQFTDPFVPRWWRWLPFAAMLALGAIAIAVDTMLAWHVVNAAALLVVGVGVFRTLAGRAADLVEPRRQARLWFAGGIGVWIATTTLLGAIGASAFPAISGVLGFALVAALLRLRLDKSTPARSSAPAPSRPGAAPTQKPPEIDADERALQTRLLALMEKERIYREPGLTVGMLAERLAVPEYRLRRLINQRLGHRNFVGFVNFYRLADVMAALADHTQARVPVLTIALDAGFQSIGPFNRAFKTHTGETPTEYRKSRLAREPAGGAA